MSTLRDASRDAKEYARAQMFFGEGAGTRRKLIQATVDSRAHRDPTYARAFHMALENQDMAQHAKKAIIERHRIDRSAALAKNVKAVLTGNSKAMNTSVLILGSVVVVLHQTGYDRVLITKGKNLYADIQARRRRKKHMHTVHQVNNLRY